VQSDIAVTLKGARRGHGWRRRARLWQRPEPIGSTGLPAGGPLDTLAASMESESLAWDAARFLLAVLFRSSH